MCDAAPRVTISTFETTTIKYIFPENHIRDNYTLECRFIAMEKLLSIMVFFQQG